MKRFFDWSLPVLFILSLAPLTIQVLFPRENASGVMYCWYFFHALLNSANFAAYLCYKSLSKSFSKCSVIYIITSVLLLMFNVLMAMFITLVF